MAAWLGSGSDGIQPLLRASGTGGERKPVGGNLGGGREAIWRDMALPSIRDCIGPGLAKKGLCKPGTLRVNVNGNCIVFVAVREGKDRQKYGRVSIDFVQ